MIMVDTHLSYVQRLKFDVAPGKAITIESATAGRA
jgi:DNA-binding transcriptional regulator YdaS (Cro superfamily)